MSSTVATSGAISYPFVGGDITDILVLYGGNSAERAVSVQSALRVIEAFSKTEHRTLSLDWSGEAPSTQMLGLAKACDAVFLALHGGTGEGGTLQQELEKNGVFHYTGSDATGSALALDKGKAKDAVAAVGVPVARGATWEPFDPPPAIPLPAIAKSLLGGSSVGLRRIEKHADLMSARSAEPILLEEYLPGREFTVGVLEGRTLPAVEIIPDGGVYDYEHKYTPGATRELCPAPIDATLDERLGALALLCFRALGLRDLARIDFKLNAQGKPCFLEANTLPGLTATSLLPLAARAAGLSFPTLCERLAALAAKRKRKP